MTKQLITLLVLLAAAPVSAQAPPQASSPQPASGVQTSGRISTGVQQFQNNTDSSKFNEYRDIRDNVYLFDLAVDLLAPRRGVFLNLFGNNVSRLDQSLRLSVGDVGMWRADVTWNEIPHDLSNKAQSPYAAGAGGVVTVPQPMLIPFKKLATAAADTPGVLASDDVIAAYARSFVRPIDLGNQTNTGTVLFRAGAVEGVDLAVQYNRRTQRGNRLTYGPIGDRPPRTLNIEMPEPVDYRTGDVTVAAEHHGSRYQTRVEYLFSDFANRVDGLFWQNIYATPEPGATFEVWDRLVAAYGARPLPPDNRYHNATATAGLDLPLASRLTGTFSYGRLQQNEPLMPYAFQVDALANRALPRSTADARINTVHLAADYVIAPLPRFNARAFFHHYDLNNDTPSSQWQYVTSDTTNVNGTVSYLNKRVSLPYAWDRQNAGVDTTYRLPAWGSSVVFGYERDGIGREFREADTTEDILRASWRARPNNWLSLRAQYMHGARDGGLYNNTVTREGYWYAFGEATDANNPAFTFDNHPDIRRYDVSDRRRDQVNVTGGVTPSSGSFSISGTVRYRRDDFDSEVRPAQPLVDTSFAERTATSPGDQLGLLRDRRRQITVDVFYAPTDRASASAFVGWDRGDSRQRSLEFNENNKANPSTIATAELGPWTRGSSQWMADFMDRATFAGVGSTFALVPERVSLSANYTASFGRVDVEYTGYGVTNFDGTPFPPNHQFFFQTPQRVRHDVHVADLRVELPLVQRVTLLVGYTFEAYRIRDWQQEEAQPWVEPVGSELLLRDTSRSFQ